MFFCRIYNEVDPPMLTKNLSLQINTEMNSLNKYGPDSDYF